MQSTNILEINFTPPTSQALRLANARMAMHSDDFERAFTLYSEILSNMRQEKEINAKQVGSLLMLIGNCLLATRSFMQAEMYFSLSQENFRRLEVAENHALLVKALLAQAHTQLEQERNSLSTLELIDEAIALLKAYSFDYKLFSWAHQLRAKHFGRKGALDLADREWEKANDYIDTLNLSPSDDEEIDAELDFLAASEQEYALYLAGKSEVDEALEVLLRATEKTFAGYYASDIACLRALSELYQLNGQPSEALNAAEEAIAAALQIWGHYHPQVGYCYLTKGHAFAMSESMSRSGRWYQKAAECFRSNVDGKTQTNAVMESISMKLLGRCYSTPARGLTQAEHFLQTLESILTESEQARGASRAFLNHGVARQITAKKGALKRLLTAEAKHPLDNQ